MHKGMTLLLALLLIGSAGCATTKAKPAPLYSASEKTRMTLCIGMSDTTWYAANQKQAGVSKAKLQNHYRGQPNAQLNLATVDKVYSDSFKYSWDYTVAFFKECAANMANVPTDRVNMASYCMQNQLIADVSHGFKTSGAPKSKPYAYFKNFNNKTVNGIIDDVYKDNKSRSDTKIDVWNACMKPLTP